MLSKFIITYSPGSQELGVGEVAKLGESGRSGHDMEKEKRKENHEEVST